MTRMDQIKTVCVYCGSGPGTNPRFIEAATAFGKALAENGGGLCGVEEAVASITILGR